MTRAADLLTQRQLARMRTLSADHLVVGERDDPPVIRRPDGPLILVQPDGRLAATSLVGAVQSYLRAGRSRADRSARARMMR
jgi:hypothetical protein